MIKRMLMMVLVAHCVNTVRGAGAAIAQSSTDGVGAAPPGDSSGILLKPIPEKVVVLTFDDACISVEKCTGELMGIEDLCLASHVAKPITFCWPMYRVNKEFLQVMSAKGYLFGRGGNPRFAGERAYVPAADNPLNTPSFSFHDTALQSRGAFANAARQATPGRIVIFTFHGVPDLEHPGVGTEPARFEECMQYLKDNHYTVIAMRDMTNYVDAVKRTGSTSAAIPLTVTIDGKAGFTLEAAKLPVLPLTAGAEDSMDLLD